MIAKCRKCGHDKESHLDVCRSQLTIEDAALRAMTAVKGDLLSTCGCKTFELATVWFPSFGTIPYTKLEKKKVQAGDFGPCWECKGDGFLTKSNPAQFPRLVVCGACEGEGVARISDDFQIKAEGA